MSAYKRQGVVENIKVPRTQKYHSLAESTKNPVASSKYGMLELPDLGKFGRSDQLHIAFRAVWAFQKANGRYPDLADKEAFVALGKEVNAAAKAAEEYFMEELDDKVLEQTGIFSQSSVCAQAAFFGGFLAQEIVKFTGKYTPLQQWLHYDIFDALPTGEVNREPEGGRYDDQIRMFGREVQRKLENTKTLMIGAGALGCEFIKAFAMMGLGCSESGKVHNTDNDNIEISNLNRQFLFRRPHVGKSKSQSACAIGKVMNPKFNVTAYTAFVGPETEDLFNDALWESLDFVVNAVDNVKARLYVDSRCLWYEKGLLESGTLGTKANSQMVIPHKTMCYGDSQDPPEESIPMCTLRNFPNQIEHCIEWGRD
jgi:ubiquitin-activating enzyme E1